MKLTPRVRAFVVSALLLGGLIAHSVFWLTKARREGTSLIARRSDLRRVYLALRGYYMYRGSFPRGTIPNSALPPEKRLSWLATLSPYWDYGGLYNAINMSEAWDSEAKTGDSPGNLRLSKLNYLTDYEPDIKPLLDQGWTPFVGIAGLGLDSPGLPSGHPRSGAFGYDRGTREQDIRDGLNTTMIVAETTMANGPWLAGGPATVRGLDPNRRPYIGQGRQYGGLNHRGALILFADGSIRVLRESTDPRVFEALSTVAGGEALPVGWDE